MAGIFISYAHEDQAAAKRIVDALAREGLDAWWDHQIPPGQTWDEVIGQRIEAAEAVVVLWSKSSIGSNFVKEEAQLAYDAGKFLPVKIDDSNPPVGFRRTHAANLADWHGDVDHAQWRALVSEMWKLLRQVQPRPVTVQGDDRRRKNRFFLPTAVAAFVAITCAVVLWNLSHDVTTTPPVPSEESRAESYDISQLDPTVGASVRAAREAELRANAAVELARQAAAEALVAARRARAGEPDRIVHIGST